MKKAARKGVSEELKKRVQTIKDEKEITLDDKGRIIWKGNQIARLQKGHNYQKIIFVHLTNYTYLKSPLLNRKRLLIKP